MNKQTCLMLGAGHTPAERKLFTTDSARQHDTKWITLDFNADAKPDVLFDLWDLENGLRLPFEDDTFDEIHAYEVLEHFGVQGDFRGFFATFRELWRILKPNGFLIGTSPDPSGEWAWSDPGHTRVISYGSLQYLTRTMYARLGKSPASDYRRLVDPRWWEVRISQKTDSGGHAFILQKSS